MRTSDWSSDVCSSDLKTTGFFGWFNRTFVNGAERYERGLGRVIRSPKRAILLYGLLIIGLGAMFVRLPTGFLPEERSEEHTSELQSLMRNSYAVFCLKTKKRHTPATKQHIII